MSKTVVILGAGPAGLMTAHYLLTFTLKALPDLRVILVSPNDEFYWSLASPRAIIPDRVPDSKLFFGIPDAFAKYPPDSFEFVAGRALRLDPAANSVVVQPNNDGEQQRTLSYDAAVVATGSRARDDMPWKAVGTSQETHAALDKLREAVGKAKTIVIGGAGVSGVEVAGELGTAYGKSGEKSISIICADSLPLEARLTRNVRQTAQSQLTKMKVRVVADTKVTGTSVAEDGATTTLELMGKDGSKETLVTDLYIPTIGSIPNTEFAPEEMRDADGRLKQDTYLRAPGHDNVFVIGDAGSLEPMQGVKADAQVKHLGKNFEAYLKTGKAAEYKVDAKIMIGVSIGPNGGTGQMGTMKLFSWLVKMVKGRYLGTDYTPDLAAGLRSMTGKW